MGEAGNAPNFVNVGPGRCGTSWLFQMLQAHPDIAMARVKETEYFNSNFDRDDAWYVEHFPQSAKAVGEVSNMYYVDSAVPERIHAFDPNMKIIFNVRDPEDLFRSMTSFAARRGIEVDDIAALLDMPIGRIMGSGWSERARSGNLNRGDEVPLREAVLLSRYVRRFADVFPHEQIFLMEYDRIAQAPGELLRDLYTFLGVRPDFVPEGADKKVNAAIAPRFRVVGQLATKVSFTLRRLGAHGLLTRLHQSNLVKRLFYRRIESADIVATADLPVAFREALAAERRAMAELLASLDREKEQLA